MAKTGILCAYTPSMRTQKSELCLFMRLYLNVLRNSLISDFKLKM